jgi:hypothetical protein
MQKVRACPVSCPRSSVEECSFVYRTTDLTSTGSDGVGKEP